MEKEKKKGKKEKKKKKIPETKYLAKISDFTVSWQVPASGLNLSVGPATELHETMFTMIH